MSEPAPYREVQLTQQNIDNIMAMLKYIAKLLGRGLLAGLCAVTVGGYVLVQTVYSNRDDIDTFNARLERKAEEREVTIAMANFKEQLNALSSGVVQLNNRMDRFINSRGRASNSDTNFYQFQPRIRSTVLQIPLAPLTQAKPTFTRVPLPALITDNGIVIELSSTAPTVATPTQVISTNFPPNSA